MNFFLDKVFSSLVKEFFIAVKKTTHIQGKCITYYHGVTAFKISKMDKSWWGFTLATLHKKANMTIFLRFVKNET